MQLIPTSPDDPFYEQRVTLEEKDYILLFTYNQREDRFYLSVSLPDGTSLVRGLKLVFGAGLGLGVADRRWPGGVFIVGTEMVDRSSPGLGELGEDRRCQLYYVPRGELVTTA